MQFSWKHSSREDGSSDQYLVPDHEGSESLLLPKNPKDPRNINNNQKTERIFPNNQKAKNEGSNVIKNLTYDTVKDINKIVAGFAHDVIVGDLGALTGIIAGGGNVGLDATAGGLTSLKQNAPKITKPKNQKNNVDATSGGKDAPKP